MDALPSAANDEEADDELRVAFDFDGVIADDSAEQVFQKEGMKAFYSSETERLKPPSHLLAWRSVQEAWQPPCAEDEREEQDRNYRRFLKTAIVTACVWHPPISAHQYPALLNITVDETHFRWHGQRTHPETCARTFSSYDQQDSHLTPPRHSRLQSISRLALRH